ncbi:protein-disulfide reductase DsbD family protein [Peredibacter sp. HCB2-198]|uniref:protein-disulfide reductase DsbD family protein n=1 Tax=Peredibacter sp. HCB2-198 TaxID=3383025 RepID=UPI0038B48C8B
MLKAIVLLILSASLWAAEEHATVSVQRFQKKLVVTINHDEGWHTYWKNPGDAGIASTFKFSQNTKPVDVKAYEWPAPKRYIEAGDILTIGYSGKKHFFFDDVPGAFDLHVGMLICKDICIPGEAKLKLGAGEDFMANRMAKPFPADELEKAFKELPAEASLPAGFEYYLTRTKDQPNLTLHYSLKNFKSPKLPETLNLLTGFPQAPWGFKRESLYLKDGVIYGKTEIEWDGEYQDPVVPLPANGQFPKPYELKFLINAPDSAKVNVVTLKLQDFANATPALNEFYKNLPPFDGKGTSVVAGTTGTQGNIFEYFLFAFLGGLILNLMPCVLPVISLKLFGLIKHKNLPKKKILGHNLSYTAGVLSTFMALGGVIAALKATGEEIGWGFQLQSPAFILVMMLILFILSLNLFGLFEFVTPGGSKLGSAEIKESVAGDFFSGILTTILSTPCSAPFLGTALTFAFTTSTLNIFLMFFFIGLGLAFPFLMTAFFPAALAIFPRPGAWMEKLKYFLGLSLVATVIWLYDVFVTLVDFDKISWRLNLLFALWFFAFFFAQKISKSRVLQTLAFALPFAMTVMAIQNLEMRPTTTDAVTKSDSQWKPWSEEKLNDEKGKLVFMDFTAEWCLTCKVNKRLVMETDGFNELAKKYDLVLLRADWTKRDDNITQFLKRYNVVGVPAYFVQKADGQIVHLGETISLSKIESNLN